MLGYGVLVAGVGCRVSSTGCGGLALLTWEPNLQILTVSYSILARTRAWPGCTGWPGGGYLGGQMGMVQGGDGTYHRGRGFSSLTGYG